MEKRTLNFIKYTLSWIAVLHRPQRVLYCTEKCFIERIEHSLRCNTSITPASVSSTTGLLL